MLWVYNIGILLYGFIIYLISPFSTKAAFFVSGRKHLYKKIASRIDTSRRHIWFHFASLGEFEQGRPVLEKIKKIHPDKPIIVTFFSPSGYEIRKDYALAEGVFYLPLDTAKNAEKFIMLINPEIAVFTKYEYWYHYFHVLSTRKVPLFIISGIFRADQVYFKWYGNFNRKILGFVDHFFLQNEESRRLLTSINLKNMNLSGDTRFDRVAENANSPKPSDEIAEFCEDAPILIAGSTWPKDESLLTSLLTGQPDWKFIIAPHEVDREHIINLQKIYPGSITYSQLIKAPRQNTQVLIIDNIGLLSSLYQYGNVAYIGGGFGAGIHNTLEAAAFGLPVIFGTNYTKFKEAKDIMTIKAGFSIANEAELKQVVETLINDGRFYTYASTQIKLYVEQHTGATNSII